MTSTDLNTEPSKEKGDWVEVLAKYIGLIGGILGIIGAIVALKSYGHALKIEEKAERRSCIGTLSIYPPSLINPLSLATESVFVWVDRPLKGNRYKALQDLQKFLELANIAQGQLDMYECKIQDLTSPIKEANQVVEKIKAGDQVNVDVDTYSYAVGKLKAAHSFAKQCCPNG